MNIKLYKGEIDFREKTGFKGELNIFFSEQFKNYKLSTKSNFKLYYYLCSDDFVIPVLLHKYLFFCYAEFISEPAKYNDLGESENNFINDVCNYLRNEFKVQWLLSTPVYAFFQSFPQNSKVIRFGSQVLDLTQSIETLFQNMDRKHREMTRRGEKGGVKIKISDEELINDFCSIETSLWKKSGVSVNNVDNSYYQSIFKNLGQNANICIAYKNNCPQVGLIIYFNNKIAYAMHAGRAEEMEPGANNLLYWKVIEYLKSKQVEKFSIVGFRINADQNSKVYDIQRFKTRFGGRLEEGYMFKSDFNPFFHHLFNLLIKIFSLLRGLKIKKTKDIIDQEIDKWKEIQNF